MQQGIIFRAEQSRAEQSRAEQSRAEQSRAEQSRAEQSRAEQSRADNLITLNTNSQQEEQRIRYSFCWLFLYVQIYEKSVEINLKKIS
jgi:hypothetical protein